ncbi:MAG: TrbI/VirB10 family protein [Firmicutes bacterium]|nr:TrbI/VirB10 family protein [Bacillota bacterium]MDH7494400.1 hypothetical protein [Bacillota bacterium]
MFARSKRRIRRVVAAIALSAIFTASSLVPAFAAFAQEQQPTLLKSLAEIEAALYGRELTGAIVDRVARLESELLGKPQEGSVIDRIARLRRVGGGGPGVGPSVAYKLTAVEWFVQRRVTSEPAVTKLDRLETMLLGAPSQGSIVVRADHLAALCLPEGTLRTKDTTLPAGQPVRIRLIGRLDSSVTQKGQKVDIEVARDVVVGNELVIPKGTRGYGMVTDVSPAGRLGKDGKITLELKDVRTLDGVAVPLAFDESTQQLNESMQLAIGAGLAGFIVFGPVGALGAFFVQGKDVNIPDGTEFYVAVGADTKVLGMTLPVDTAVELAKDAPTVKVKPGK